MSFAKAVALLAEGVDRNFAACQIMAWAVTSPSSRRAWIEIISAVDYRQGGSVALLAEGVDRNIRGIRENMPELVALLAEGVDRNNPGKVEKGEAMGRPPRGGRG